MRIQIKDYLVDLLQNLVYGYNKHTKISTNVTDQDMDVDRAVPLALIVNELVTNSLKYAFDNVEDPHLTVNLWEHGQHLVLEITDNGPGIHDIDFKDPNSFGYKLVRSLVSQLQGEFIYFDNKPGCGWRIKIHDHAHH
jgi:two-component sensor histidine kinase